MVFRVLALSFILAFCSLFYELIFAKTLTLATSNFILAQTAALGFYFLGIGVGSSKKIDPSKPLSFLHTEYVLSFLGCISPALIYFIYFIFHLYMPSSTHIIILPTLLLIPFVVGIFTGKEFLHLLNFGEKHGVSASLVLAATYFGNLVAGFAFPLFIYQSAGVVGSSYFAAALNLMVAIFLAIEVKKHTQLFLAIPITLCFFFWGSNAAKVQNGILNLSYTKVYTPDFGTSHLKNIYVYVKSKMPSVRQHRTKYQDIDIVHKSNGHYSLFLNRKPQFSSDNYKGYHASLAEGFLNLHQNPLGNTLILGGGDGILAQYLIERGAKRITLIDLDPAITNLARTHPLFRRINKDSFNNKIVTVINGDAFSFLLKTSEKYDSILIDFPLPTSLELSKLYSREFYSLVKRSLKPNGGALFDSPINFKFDYDKTKFKSKNQKIISATLHAAGIKNHTGFGPHENFVYFNKKDEKRHFQYDLLPDSISGRALVNLIENSSFLEEAPIEKKYINSIFSPKRFQ
ncbi:MAG: spermidine synthase [Bdellovibrionales bacterium]